MLSKKHVVLLCFYGNWCKLDKWANISANNFPLVFCLNNIIILKMMIYSDLSDLFSWRSDKTSTVISFKKEAMIKQWFSECVCMSWVDGWNKLRWRCQASRITPFVVGKVSDPLGFWQTPWPECQPTWTQLRWHSIQMSEGERQREKIGREGAQPTKKTDRHGVVIEWGGSVLAVFWPLAQVFFSYPLFITSHCHWVILLFHDLIYSPKGQIIGSDPYLTNHRVLCLITWLPVFPLTALKTWLHNYHQMEI